ncbi:MAG: YbjN domain-containing protein [Cellulomonadaceae bacterium]
MELWIRRAGRGLGATVRRLAPAWAAAAPAAGAPARVHRNRLAAWFDARGYHHFVDADGDLGGLWRSRPFSFLLLGEHEEILQVRAQWNREVTIERLEEVITFCNDWNADRIWPKTYVRVGDDGMIRLCAELSIDVEDGIDDDQLDQFLTGGIGSATLFFDALSELYPDPAEAAP